MCLSRIISDVLCSRGSSAAAEGIGTTGLAFLGRIAEAERSTALPGLFYSYLGYGIALRQRRVQEGLKLCQHSIKVEFYEPENYVNLARTYLLAGDRPGAVRAVREGLKVIRQHPELLALYRELGIRAQPVLPFLSRSNPLNQLLGRLRHAWRGDAPKRRGTPEKTAGEEGPAPLTIRTGARPRRKARARGESLDLRSAEPPRPTARPRPAPPRMSSNTMPRFCTPLSRTSSMKSATLP